MPTEVRVIKVAMSSTAFRAVRENGVKLETIPLIVRVHIGKRLHENYLTVRPRLSPEKQDELKIEWQKPSAETEAPLVVLEGIRTTHLTDLFSEDIRCCAIQKASTFIVDRDADMIGFAIDVPGLGFFRSYFYPSELCAFLAP